MCDHDAKAEYVSYPFSCYPRLSLLCVSCPFKILICDSRKMCVHARVNRLGRRPRTMCDTLRAVASREDVCTHWVGPPRSMPTSPFTEMRDKRERRKSMPDPFRRSILHMAAETGNLTMVALLLENQNAINSTDSRGFTPLHLAALSGYNQVCQLLCINGANVYFADQVGRTALHLASFMGHVRIVVVSHLCTALHLASFMGHIRIAVVSHLCTALHLASFMGHVRIAVVSIRALHCTSLVSWVI